MDQEIMEVTAGMHAGDHDRFYATATVGYVKVTVYESTTRPGGVTVEIDVPDDLVPSVSVCINDWEINHGR